MADFQLFGGLGGKPKAADGGTTTGGADGDLIKDTTTATFMADVVEASQSVTVLVDFWAPWCGPCKQLTPTLEKIVRESGGTVKLVKMNIDTDPSVAQQMGVQSIPAVFAFKDGRPVDGFMGAVTESQVKEFVARVAGPAPAELEVADLIAAADEAGEAGDIGKAVELYAAVLSQDAENAAGIAGLARCYLSAGEIERAKQTLGMATAEAANDPAVVSAVAAVELAEKAAGAIAEKGRLEAAIAANANDHQARFDLALALTAMNDKAGAVSELIEIMQRDRSWNEDGARKELVSFFEAWGPTDPATIDGRRRLSLVLFS